MAVGECDFGNGQEWCRPAGPVALDERAVARIALEVLAEVGNADANPAAGTENPAAVVEQRDSVGEREVLDDVLEEHGRRRAVREREAPAQIPVQVRLHPEDVDVYPAPELVRPTAEMESYRA